RVGSTAAILADPRRAVEQALALAAAEGVAPQPGWVLLAGAATEAVPLTPGCRVRAVVEELGGASLTARGGEVTAPGPAPEWWPARPGRADGSRTYGSPAGSRSCPAPRPAGPTTPSPAPRSTSWAPSAWTSGSRPGR